MSPTVLNAAFFQESVHAINHTFILIIPSPAISSFPHEIADHWD